MHLTFADLERLPIIAFYETAFRNATGVPLRVVSPDEPRQRVSMGPGENPFCTLVACTPEGCAACREVQSRTLRTVGKRNAVQQVSCFAGLTEVAVPVVVDGRHVATLISGQVFRREPTERDFLMVLGMMGGGATRDWEKKARAAYFATPVVTADRFEAIIHLSGMFAQFLGDYASRHAIAGAAEEPPAVANAKRFVHSHVDDAISLDDVVRHVGVSRFYFCKLFKRVTGMTFTEYVGRVRVEKAKTLLVDSSLRISEVVYASGFGSIPNFNSTFKRQVGMAPSEYRQTLRSPPSGG